MNNGDKPAHPTGHSQSGTGLSKREYFAAMAMQGILAYPHGTYTNQDSNSREPKFLAEFAIQCADELLKQLES